MHTPPDALSPFCQTNPLHRPDLGGARSRRDQSREQMSADAERGAVGEVSFFHGGVGSGAPVSGRPCDFTHASAARFSLKEAVCVLTNASATGS